MNLVDEGLILPILAILFLATLIRSAFGFGEALVAVPLLALIIPVDVAAPIAALISVTVAAIVLAQDWADVHFRSAGRLFAATLLGMPFGLILLTRVAEPLVKALLATIIIGFSVHSLARGAPPRLSDDGRAWMFGFAAGILGGAYGMNGPPLVVFGTLRGWSARHFRATLQGYFFPASTLVVLGYASIGIMTTTVTRVYLLSLPVVLLAIVLGRCLNRRLEGPLFLTLVHGGLIIVGLALFLQAMVPRP